MLIVWIGGGGGGIWAVFDYVMDNIHLWFDDWFVVVC